MQAIVLVGGEGTRLRPLTDAIPKPALTLVDRPILAYLIEWLARHEVSEVVLACGFKPDVLREALAGEESRAGTKIRYLAEPQPLGTAGAVRFAADSLGDELGESFLALNGDVLADLDLGALLRAHEDRGAAATIGVHPVEDSSAYGLVRCGEGGEVLEFVEKTGRREPGEINAGMYALERSVLDLIPAGENVSIERDVFPRLAERGELRGLRLDGYWTDVGTPQRYLEASWDVLEGRIETGVRPTAPGIYLAPDAGLEEGARIVPRAVVGPRCRIGAGAEVRDSVLLDGSAVGAGARVTGSILAPGAELAAGAELNGTVAAPDARVPIA